jgi:uncharacterized peroxidase-related enzyme
MARISYGSWETLPEGLQALWERVLDYAPFASLLGAMARRPPIFAHMFAMQAELRDEGRLSLRHRELVKVAVSRLNACPYCIAHHEPLLTVEGLSAEGTERILDHADHPELDQADKLVVEYAIAVTERAYRIGDELFRRLRAHFGEEEIVELTWETALCGAFNRFNSALELDIEPELAAERA